MPPRGGWHPQQRVCYRFPRPLGSYAIRWHYNKGTTATHLPKQATKPQMDGTYIKGLTLVVMIQVRDTKKNPTYSRKHTSCSANICHPSYNHMHASYSANCVTKGRKLVARIVGT
jgi:hypothetical protein